MVKLAEVEREGLQSLEMLCQYVSAYSPFLDRLIHKHRDWLFDQYSRQAEDVISELLTKIEGSDQEDLGRVLRIRKGRIALYLGLMDIVEAWDVMSSTNALTRFADFAVETSLSFLIRAEIARGRLPHDCQYPRAGIFVLAMGKQGAFELNYSSDIDLICFFDEARFPNNDPYDIRKILIRVVQNLVKLLSEVTSDGYVFRVDLRLRPDPSVTPVVLACDQALSYYEALGRTWERAAFIKARACAGDLEAGADFLKELRPFIWRRHLDFAAIEDAHNMRLRIREHKNLDGPIALSGHNLKLGRGGIREIEFFTQTRQLIFGGRNENLRSAGTIESLQRLAREQVITEDLASELIGEYRWLRRLEHATQMIGDQQTHQVPESEEGLRQFLGLLRIENGKDFETQFRSRLELIDSLMEKFFNISGRTEPLEESQTLDSTSLELVEQWSQLPATRSERAQVIFDRLRPTIMKSLMEADDSKAAFLAFDRFLRGLPAGVQLFSMFEANPRLLEILTDICVLTPAEAAVLGSNSRIFEAVLSPVFFAPLTGSDEDFTHFKSLCLHEIGENHDYEHILDAVRRFVRENQFRVSVHLLKGLVDPKVAGVCYSMIAEIALQTLHQAADAEMQRRYGPAPGRGAAILAMGKLGSAEMTRTSDLDLVVIYDAGGAEMNDGPKPLAVSNYFSRFTQILIQALSVATAEGSLYEVDMRLRPSGNKGPVAVSLAGFADYQLNEAWTWEHLALLRSRVVSGEQTLKFDVEEAMRQALSKTRDKEKQAKDIADMREKIRTSLKPEHELSLKYGAGRLMETELLIQALALLNGCVKSGQSSRSLIVGLKNVLSNEEFHFLFEHFELMSVLSQLSRLSFAGDPPIDVSPNWINLQNIFTNINKLSSLISILRNNSSLSSALFEKRIIENELGKS